jgi:hypothetical protein
MFSSVRNRTLAFRLFVPCDRAQVPHAGSPLTKHLPSPFSSAVLAIPGSLGLDNEAKRRHLYRGLISLVLNVEKEAQAIDGPLRVVSDTMVHLL